MSKRRYRRRSKMKRRGVENASQHGFKMAPTWLQNCFLEASGQPLGPDPASRHSPEPSRRGSGTARGVPKILLGGLGTPLERKVDRFQSPGGSRSGSGRSFWELLGGWARGNEKKARKVTRYSVFWSCFCMRFLTACVCRLLAPALAGVKAQIKKLLKTKSFYSIICVCAVCATSANILQRERKSNKKRAKQHAKNTMQRKLKKPFKKHRLGSQHASKNRPRRPPGAPWPPPARDFRAKSTQLCPKSRQERPDPV